MKQFVTTFALALTALVWTGCTEKEYTATTILAVQAPMPGAAAPIPEHLVRKQAALLTSLSTIRETVERKRFQDWEFYRGNSVEQTARQILSRVRATVMPNTNLIQLTCVHPDREAVFRIVNGIAETVIDEQVRQGRKALRPPLADLSRKRDILRAQKERAVARTGSPQPEFSTHREMALEFDRLRQSLLTYSGKLDELAISIATAAPLARQIAAATAEDGAGLASLYSHPDLTRLQEARDLTVDLNTATADLQSRQEYLSPEHPQVQAAMDRVRDLTARLAEFRDSWLLGKMADYDALLEKRERVAELQSRVAAEFRKLSEIMAIHDQVEKECLHYDQQLAIIDARIEELGDQIRQVRARLEVLEPATRPREAR